MAEERKHVQKSPLSHILSVPSASKKRTFSEKRFDKPDVEPDMGPAPQSAPPPSVPAAGNATTSTDTANVLPKVENDEVERAQNPLNSKNDQTNSSMEDTPQSGPHDTEDIAPQTKSPTTEPQNDGEVTGNLVDDQGDSNDVPESRAEEGPEEDAVASSKEETETSQVEPATKKLKIDSSRVIESVGGFKRYVSSVVVYSPGQSLLDGLEDHLNSIVWIRIARRFITRSNPGVLRRKLWGTDVYTDDSDIVAALYHSGHLDPESEDDEIKKISKGSSDLLVGVLTLPKLKKYTGCYLHELNSRSWGSHHDGASFRVETVAELPCGSAEYPASESVNRALMWSSIYLHQKEVRESLRL